ncbi:MAG: PGPGW domain-containing protein [Nanoarchaeota archaeon]
MTRFIRIFIGIALIIAGIVSLFLPFSPGLLFLFAGLVLLGSKRAKAAFMKAHKKASVWFGPKAGKLFLIPLAHLEDNPEKSLSHESIKEAEEPKTQIKNATPSKKTRKPHF